jgi:hypothetical protein
MGRRGRPKKKVSDSDNADGSSVASAGKTVIIGWQTGYTYYDNNYDTSVNRQLKINYSTDAGGTWKGVTALTPGTGFVDYPIVGAAKTTAGPVNLYAVWIDSKNGKVMFRQKSGTGVWTAPLSIGTTTAKIEGAAYGYSGYANIAATGDLITAAWIADPQGHLKARTIDLNGAAKAANTLSNWSSAATLTGAISIDQNGFPIVSASPLVTNITTIAWNTANAQVYTTANGTAVDTSPVTIFTNGTTGGRIYAGGYSTAVEPGPGGYIASWGACRDTSLTLDCNYGSNKARFDLLVSTSANGTAWNTPTRLGDSAASAKSTLNDEGSMVLTAEKSYIQYNVYNAGYTAYDVWARVGTGSP